MRVRAGGLSGRGRVRHGFLTGGMGMLLAGVVGAGLTGGGRVLPPVCRWPHLPFTRRIHGRAGPWL
jgi:hypothetical protein